MEENFCLFYNSDKLLKPNDYADSGIELMG